MPGLPGTLSFSCLAEVVAQTLPHINVVSREELHQRGILQATPSCNRLDSEAHAFLGSWAPGPTFLTVDVQKWAVWDSAEEMGLAGRVATRSLVPAWSSFRMLGSGGVRDTRPSRIGQVA